MPWKTLLVALLLLAPLGARPLPEVVPPGAEQPRPPSQQEAPPLPQLHWPGRSPQIHKVELANNGHLHIAHALLLLGPEDDPWRYCHEAAHGAFGAQPELDELDLSLYRGDQYLGFGGPLLLTAPRQRRHKAPALRDFSTPSARLNPNGSSSGKTMDRVGVSRWRE